MPRPTRAFKYPLALDSGRAQFAVETDHAAHVDQMIRQVLLTAPGERIDRPDFGAGLRALVFAPNGDAAAAILETTVRQSLEKWLGDVITVDEVTAEAREETLVVDLTYTLVARQERRFLNLEVTL